MCALLVIRGPVGVTVPVRTGLSSVYQKGKGESSVPACAE